MQCPCFFESAVCFYAARIHVRNGRGGTGLALRMELSTLTAAVRDEGSDRSYAARGRYYLDHNDFDRAFRDYDKAIELNLKSHEYFAARGYALYKGGRLDEALQDFNTALQLFPQNKLARVKRAKCFGKKLDFDACLEDCDAALQLGFDPEAALLKALVLFKLNRMEDAIAACSFVLQHKESAKALLCRSTCYHRLHNLEAALLDLEALLLLDGEDRRVKRRIEIIRAQLDLDGDQSRDEVESHTLESLFTFLQLQEFYPTFVFHEVNTVSDLSKVPSPDLKMFIPDEEARRRLTSYLVLLFNHRCRTKALQHAQQPAPRIAPKEFYCPITLEMMENPVVLADGYSYERDAICTWIASGNECSPMTNDYLSSTVLYTNFALKNLIQRWKEGK